MSDSFSDAQNVGYGESPMEATARIVDAGGDDVHRRGRLQRPLMRHRLQSIRGIGEVSIEVVVPCLQHVDSYVSPLGGNKSADLVDVLGSCCTKHFEPARSAIEPSA